MAIYLETHISGTSEAADIKPLAIDSEVIVLEDTSLQDRDEPAHLASVKVVAKDTVSVTKIDLKNPDPQTLTESAINAVRLSYYPYPGNAEFVSRVIYKPSSNTEKAK